MAGFSQVVDHQRLNEVIRHHLRSDVIDYVAGTEPGPVFGGAARTFVAVGATVEWSAQAEKHECNIAIGMIQARRMAPWG
jgi:hypothetical protein